MWLLTVPIGASVTAAIWLCVKSSKNASLLLGKPSQRVGDDELLENVFRAVLLVLVRHLGVDRLGQPQVAHHRPQPVGGFAPGDPEQPPEKGAARRIERIPALPGGDERGLCDVLGVGPVPHQPLSQEEHGAAVSVVHGSECPVVTGA
jgi:hypothetical protein